jgi:dihydrofolate synthase
MNFRAVPASSLKELWVAAAHYPDINYVDIGTIVDIETLDYTDDLVGLPSSFRKQAGQVPRCVFM